MHEIPRLGIRPGPFAWQAQIVIPYAAADADVLQHREEVRITLYDSWCCCRTGFALQLVLCAQARTIRHCRNSSFGGTSDRRSDGPRFDPGSRHVVASLGGIGHCRRSVW